MSHNPPNSDSVSDKMPPLPEPDVKSYVIDSVMRRLEIATYTRTLLLAHREAYAAAKVAAERERLAELMERQHTWISAAAAAQLIRNYKP